MGEAISVSDLQVSYHGKAVLQNITFSVPEGNMVGIVGPNGAGKSTLIKALLRLIPIDRGTIELLESPLHDARKRVAYVPQRSDIDWNFPITVLQTVLIGTYPSLGLFRRPGKKENTWAHACLETVGMSEYAERQIGELSGGQQQRVFIARALAQRPSLLLLDEPFAGIDIQSEQTILQVLRDLRDQGHTVVLVHHDLNKVRDYFDSILLINKVLVASGPIAECFNQETIARTYAYGANPLLLHGIEVSV